MEETDNINNSPDNLKNPIKIPKKTILVVIVISVLLIAGVFFFFSGKSVSGNVVNAVEVQKITLGMNGNYYPNSLTVKAGVPVEITLDSSIRGCYRNFNIPGLRVSQSSSSPTDTIKFTPKEKGTFNFRCSMGMGTGTIVVD